MKTALMVCDKDFFKKKTYSTPENWWQIHIREAGVYQLISITLSSYLDFSLSGVEEMNLQLGFS
jgi:hypothetical protein